MSTLIHPTAVIEKGAELGSNVSVGPYSVIGANVKVGDGTQVMSQVSIDGHTTIGENNKIFPFTAIGGEPQSISYKGEPTEVRIGDNNVFRENITVNRGHIAHDCRLGSELLFSNNASLAGHARVADYVVLAGYTLIHQFVNIGEHSFCGVNTYCVQDIPPFMLVSGNKAITHGINVRGLRRRGFTKEDTLDLKRAYKLIYRSGHTMKHALEELDSREWESEHVATLSAFIAGSTRGVVR